MLFSLRKHGGSCLLLLHCFVRYGKLDISPERLVGGGFGF